MIWAVIAAFALLALIPLAWSLRAPGVARGRQSAALDLHRAQLAEIDRDLEQGRIALTEHAIARLEIQRRMLAETEATDAPARASLGPLLITLAFIPAAAVILYLPGANPNMPAVPLAQRLAAQRKAESEARKLAAELEAKIATLPPESDQARQGYMLLGNLEDTRNDLAAAADAWSKALAIRFDPTLAAEIAEARTRTEGSVSPASAALFRQALAAAPPDAPWRSAVEQRLASIGAPPPTP